MPGRFGTFVCLETEFLYYVALALLELTMQTRLTVGFRENTGRHLRTLQVNVACFQRMLNFLPNVIFKYGLKRFNSVFHSF